MQGKSDPACVDRAGQSKNESLGETDRGDDNNDQGELGATDSDVSVANLGTVCVLQRAVRHALHHRMHGRLGGDARRGELEHVPVAAAETYSQTGHGGDDGTQRRHVEWRFTGREVGDHRDQHREYGGDRQHCSAREAARVECHHPRSIRSAADRGSICHERSTYVPQQTNDVGTLVDLRRLRTTATVRWHRDC